MIITSDAAVTALRAVVAERGPEYVDPNAKANVLCRYEEDGRPSCVVGAVLARLGVPVTTLAMLDLNPKSILGVARLAPSRPGWGFTVTPDAERVLGAAQAWQDRGHEYATVLAEAEEAYAE